MPLVQTLGSAVKGSSSLTTVLTVSVTTTVGNRVVVRCGVAASASAATLSIADTKGNTWTQHIIGNTAAALSGAVFSAVLTTPLVSGDTITVTQSGTATANGFIEATEWSGLTTPVASGSNTVNTLAATTVTGISATEAAGATYFGILHTNNGTNPVTSGSLSSPWNTTETGQTGSTNLHWYGTWDQTQASGTTVSFAPTLTGASCSYVGLLVAFTTSSVNVAAGTLTLTGAAAASGSAPAAGAVVLDGLTTAPNGTPGAAAGIMSLSGASAAGTAAVIHHWVGAATAAGFRVRAKTSGATACRLAVSTSPSMTSPTYFGPLTPVSGYVDFTATGLAAQTQFYYQLTDNPGIEVPLGSVGKAKTLPVAGAASFKFAFGGCTNGYNVNREAVDDIRTWGADFFLHHGDFHYKSLTSTDPLVHQQGWEDQIKFAPGLLDLCRDVPMWYCRSDHEAGPDNGDSNNAYTAASIQGYQNLMPYGTLGDVQSPPHGLYQTWVVGRVRFILIDVRNIDRSPGSSTDNSSKTMLGATQKTWLKAQLLQPEPVKVIVSDVAWMGPADIVAKPDAWWSYSTERTEIASYIAANSVQVVFLHSDTHSIACASPTKNTYGGFPVYCAAPLANDGGGRDLTTFDAYYYTTPTTTDSRQYGRVVVTDTGSTITFAFSGWDAVTGTQQVSRTDVFAAPTAAGGITFTGTSSARAAATGAGVVTLAAAATARAATSTAGALVLSGASLAPGSGAAAGLLTLSGAAAAVSSSTTGRMTAGSARGPAMTPGTVRGATMTPA